MSMMGLPEPVRRVIERAMVGEFATVSGAGVPIDTPTYVFPADDLSHIGVATGLAYPAKATRARKNPRVGLLIEGLPGEPVVSVRGMAAVRDADLQANAERYISETGFEGIAYGLTWEEARKGIWYWTRIIMDIAPERVMWWDNADTMDRAPHVWQAPADTRFPPSDPAPAGKGSAPSEWKRRTWQEIAASALAGGASGHLTLCDAVGFPLPMRALDCELAGDAFHMTIPAGAPWEGNGTATLTFRGLQTFVGEATRGGGRVTLKVERALPEHPLVANPVEVLQPSDEVREQLMARLREEADRRGQPIPSLTSETPPAPTRLLLLRRERMAQIMAAQTAGS